MISEYITAHQAEFWLALGFLLLVIEVILGFSSGIFLFAGLGSLVTGGIMSIGLLPETSLAGISSTGISTALVTALLWKPLKKLQNDNPVAKDNSSDLVGHEFSLNAEISLAHPGSITFSGISWNVELDRSAGVDSIAAGALVTVTSVEVGRFKVKPA